MPSGRCLIATAAILFVGVPRVAAADGSPLVTVNGKAITAADVEAMMVARQVPEKLRPALRQVFVERLIDDHLLREFLAGRKVVAPKELVDRAVSRIYRDLRRQGADPKQALKRRGLDERGLRRQLSLGIAWSVYARQIIPKMEVKQRFEEHRAEFDGTQIRASQIVLKRPKDAAGQRKALQRLQQLRSEIVAGKITFAEAARKHSTSPTAKSGGDLGYFPFRGKMPLEIAREAFKLKDKQVGEPFLTRFGVHLVQVTGRKPGQLSLEDARPAVFEQIAQQRRRETVQRLRKSAKIVRGRE